MALGLWMCTEDGILDWFSDSLSDSSLVFSIFFHSPRGFEWFGRTYRVDLHFGNIFVTYVYTYPY